MQNLEITAQINLQETTLSLFKIAFNRNPDFEFLGGIRLSENWIAYIVLYKKINRKFVFVYKWQPEEGVYVNKFSPTLENFRNGFDYKRTME